MLKFESVLDCGCCYATMKFKSKASANKAFAAAGLSSSAVVKDDSGTIHENIDTFYGFWIKEKKKRTR